MNSLPSLTVEVSPKEAKPGEVFLVCVSSLLVPSSVWGSFEGRGLTFVRRGKEYRALAGVSGKSKPGTGRVYVKAKLPDGRVLGAVAEVRLLPRNFKVQRLSVPRRKRSLLSTKLLQADYGKLREATKELDLEPMWSASFLMPVRGRITTGYGWRRLVGSTPRGQHSGWDIAAPRGSPVKAPNEGIVKFEGNLFVHGKTVVIDHGASVVSYLLHLEEILVKPGQKLRKGQIVGTVGSTGLATGPHLHWSIHAQGTAIDPALAVGGKIPKP